MARIGLTPDEMLLTWSAASVRRYVARVPGLDVLAGETIALVGTGTAEVAGRLRAAVGTTTDIDGTSHAAAGAIRVAAQSARRAGAEVVVLSDPFTDLAEVARPIAVADLASLSQLGLTTIVEVSDPLLAAQFADRVAVVVDGGVTVAYPVLAQTPRSEADIAPVMERLQRRLATAV